MALVTALALFCLALWNESSAETAPTIALNDGYNIPLLGLGTYGSRKDIAKMREAVYWAIEAGYRHIDTAALYNNEREIGQGIADAISKGLVKREDLFITTKLWNDKHGKDQVVPAAKASLEKLGLDYVDLYLIHSTQAEKDDGSPADIDITETWLAMIEVRKQGLARSIGVSNFKTEHLDKIISNSSVYPAVNQVEIHPWLTQEQLVADCHGRGIAVTAYSPFGFLVKRGGSNKNEDSTLLSIAEKYGKSTNQVVLRYLIDRHLIPIPKSTNKQRIVENMDVFDFRLTDEDISAINKLNKNKSIFDD
ncbi:hypothetical protein O3G_MSEX006238 [Manduca sexta]|uniref:NADP-dependent oxidoreductase domain-containing protein n=1 Tax=Manduca sexta TaxID=7130 RepID=A0A921Z2R9_MANSE|nr:hypothetical protein O3G_MSEX006238 [Manduca sexta]